MVVLSSKSNFDLKAINRRADCFGCQVLVIFYTSSSRWSQTNQTPFGWQIPHIARLCVEQVEMQSAKQKEGGRGVEPENPQHLLRCLWVFFFPCNVDE